VTEDAIDRIKGTERKRRYDATDKGRAARARDACKQMEGYRLLREAGVPRPIARKWARKAHEYLITRGLV